MVWTQVHLRDKPIGDDIDYQEVALLTSGMSGAQVRHATGFAHQPTSTAAGLHAYQQPASSNGIWLLAQL